jgi:hypothetical protein
MATLRGMLRTFAVVVSLSSVCVVVTACEPAPAARLPDAPNGTEVTLKTTPPGATVTVDGVAVGQGPVRLKLRPGPHRVSAQASGYYPMAEQKIVVVNGAPEVHELTLVASH